MTMSIKYFYILFVIVHVINGSALRESEATNITSWSSKNSSQCSEPVVCQCPDGIKEYNINHVDNCSDIKNICAVHIKDHCSGSKTKCDYYNSQVTKGRPNVTSITVTRNTWEGKNYVSIPCFIQANPQAHVQWLFNGTDIQKRINSGFYDAQDSPNPKIKCSSPWSTLTLYSIQYNPHHGRYACVATNAIGQSNWTFKVVVKVFPPKKPDVSCEQTKSKVFIGSSFNLTCTAFVKQEGAIMNGRYRRRQLRVRDDSRHNLHQDRHKYIMMIKNVSANDAGDWEFRVTQSGLSSDLTKLIKLEVVPCPRGFFCPINESTSRTCPPGTYNDGKTNITYHCQRCPNGVISNRTLYVGAKSVEDCPTMERDNPDQRSDDASKGPSYVVFLAVCLPIILVVFLVVLVGWRRTRRKKKSFWQDHTDDTDIQIVYDLFISFSEKDQEFAKSLQSNIEAKGYKCCFHHRDFCPGESIVKNIADAIYQSRVTLVVLSPNYMDSKYCKQELDQALTAAMDCHRVLPVIYKPCRTPKQLHSYVTYLEYKPNHETQFWRKLLSTIENFCGPSDKRISCDSEV